MYDNKSVVICAGHHSDRKGATNSKYNLNEFDSATCVMEWLGDLLKEMGITVYTYTGRLSSKVAFINSIKPNLALDIHFNADSDHLDPLDLDNSRGDGCMVMYCPQPNMYGGFEQPNYTRRGQAACMSDTISEYLGTLDLGGRQGWYWGDNPPKSKDYFLCKTSCPAFIPELGYIDNNKFCEDWLISNKHGELAYALKLGVLKILRRLP